MTSWSPSGHSGQMFARLGKYAPPPPEGTDFPGSWGNPEVVRQRLEGHASSVDLRSGNVTFEFESKELARMWMERNVGAIAAC